MDEHPPADSDRFLRFAAIAFAIGGVTWFSWVTGAAEIGTVIVFGVAGVRARLKRDRDLTPRRVRAAA